MKDLFRSQFHPHQDCTCASGNGCPQHAWTQTDTDRINWLEAQVCTYISGLWINDVRQSAIADPCEIQDIAGEGKTVRQAIDDAIRQMKDRP